MGRHPTHFDSLGACIRSIAYIQPLSSTHRLYQPLTATFTVRYLMHQCDFICIFKITITLGLGLCTCIVTFLKFQSHVWNCKHVLKIQLHVENCNNMSEITITCRPTNLKLQLNAWNCNCFFEVALHVWNQNYHAFGWAYRRGALVGWPQSWPSHRPPDSE